MNPASRFKAFLDRTGFLSPSAFLAFLAMLLVTAAMFLVASLVSWHERESYLANNESRQVARAKRMGDKLVQGFAQVSKDAQFLAHTPPVQGIIRASRNRGFDAQEANTMATWHRRLDGIFSAFATARPSHFQLRFVGVADQGRELVRVALRDGRAVALAPEQMEQTRGSDFFQATRTLKEGEVHLSEIGLRQEQGKILVPHVRTVRAATPVFAPDGELFGMVVVDLDVGPDLDDFAANVMTGTQGYVMNDQGDYLVHPDARRTFAFDLGRRARWQDDFPGIPLSAALESGSAGQGMLTAPSAAGLVHIQLIRIGFDPLRPQRALFMAIALPDTQVSAATAPVRSLALGGTAVMFLISATLFVFYVRRVVLPLRALTTAAHRIGDGDYATPLPQALGGESATLAAAMRAMQTGIVAREQEISRTNAAASYSAEYANHVFDAAPGAMLLVDGLGHILRANRTAEPTFGYSQQELLGQPVELLIPARLHVQHKAMRYAYLDSTVAADSQVPKVMGLGRKVLGVRKDGREILLEVSLSTLKFGEDRHVIVALTDVTERKTAEQALRQNEERMRLMTHSIRDYAIVMIDLEGHVVSWNEGAFRLHGYHELEIVGQPMSRFYTPEDVAAGKPARLLALAERDGRCEDEAWRVRKDGSRFFADVVLSPIRDHAGALMGFAKITRDVTERRAAQTQAQRDREQQDTLHELLEISMANSPLEDVLERSLDKLLRVSWLTAQPLGGIFVKDESAPSLRLLVARNLPPEITSLCGNVALGHCHCGQAAASGQLQYAQSLDARHGTHYLGMKDHGHYAAPLVSDGQVLGVLMVYLPIDFERSPARDQFFTSVADIVAGAISRRRTEQALVEYQANLEQTVLVRTADLDRARQEAERLTRVKDTFLATMSHEIRTPMNAFLGMLELLALQRLNGEQTRMLAVAQQSGRSLLRIIDDILDFSKIEADKLAIHPEPASIAEMVELTASFFRPVAGSKGLRLVHRISPDISPAVMVDRLRLRQILNNFVSNAIKFTERGQVEIKAELLQHQPGLDRVRISVSDTGMGISPQVQARLFQPFSQADAETTRRHGGTGLGLAICQRLADMMQARIEMQSVPGQGTTLSLTLDLPVIEIGELRAAQESARAPAAAFMAADAPSVAVALATGTLVLLVDDHVTNREVLTAQLRALGYASEQASSSDEALRKWESCSYGLLITDCHMPDMDGYQLAREIRRQEAETGRKRTPILAWTANAMNDVADGCTAQGMDDVLVKPADLRTLKDKLARLLPPPAEPGDEKLLQAEPAEPPGALAGTLNLAVLHELSGGDADMERRVLARFRKANQPDARALARAIAEHDLAAVTQLAHRMKGAARMIGASEFAAACEALEQAGRDGDGDAIARGQARFDNALLQLERILP
ncbi:MAG: PAS domain S-box protein [Rubrivivax sp.]|nr:PAS domain S-box protein [Rubrivivax sp.]